MAGAGPPYVLARATDGTNEKSPSPDRRGAFFSPSAYRRPPARRAGFATGQEASFSSSRRIESPMTVVEQRAMPGAMMSAVRMPPDSTF